MSNLALLFVCFAVGLLLKQFKSFPKEAPQVFNRYIICVALPALVLHHIHALQFDRSFIYAALMPWLFFVLGCVFFLILGKVFHFSRMTVGCLILTASLGNTSFIGFPMIEAYYGKENLPVGIIVDQLGSFSILVTGGVIIASTFSSGKFSFKTILNKLLFFPPFYAFVLALLLRPVAYPEWLDFVLQRLGDTLSPLALISVGYQLRFRIAKKDSLFLFLGLFFKLFLGPLFILLLYFFGFGLRDLSTKIIIFEAAMAPMITGGILAVENDLNKELAVAMVSFGIILSFLTLPVWKFVMDAFF